MNAVFWQSFFSHFWLEVHSQKPAWLLGDHSFRAILKRLKNMLI